MIARTLLRACLMLATLAMTISACSLEPSYQRPQSPVTDAYPTGPAYAPAAAGTTAAADMGWRDFFADPRLQQFVEAALANNPDLRTAALNVEVLRAQFQIQAAQLFPQVDAFADRTRSRTPPSVTNIPRTELGSYSVGLSAGWEIDLFGRLRSMKHSALEQYFASVQGRKAAELLLVSQVADQYLSLLAFDELLEVTQRTLDTAQASYDLVKLQFDTGVATELDLRQAESIVAQADANRVAQLRLRAQAENGLVLLLGQPLPDAGATPTARLGEQGLIADIPAGLPSELLTRRPDVLEAEALLRSTNADIGAARAAFFPRITLTGSGGTESAEFSGLFKPGSAAWSWEPSITLPIFTAGANRANLDVAKLRKDIGIAQYEKAIQTAFREVSDGLAARGTYDAQITALVRFTEAERRRLELAQLQYTNGDISYLDVLTAQTDLYDAEQVLVTARLQRLTNLVDLYRALGGGWIEHTGDQPRSGEEPISRR